MVNIVVNGKTVSLQEREEAAQAAFDAIMNGESVSFSVERYDWLPGQFVDNNTFLSITDSKFPGLLNVCEYSVDSRERVTLETDSLHPIVRYRDKDCILYNDKYVKLCIRKHRLCVKNI